MERPDLYVVARFLERLAQPDRSFGKTDLQLAVRLNYSIYKRYLAWLVAKGYVAIFPDADGAERIQLTASGREAYARLVGWIREAVGDERL